MAGSLLGVEFQPGLQDALIRDRGLEVIHSICLKCTCQVEDVFAGMKNDGKQRQRDGFCPRCNGEGWLYRDPQSITGMVTGLRNQKNLIEMGIVQQGDLTLTPLTTQDDCGSEGRKIGSFDKITLPFEQPVDEGQVIIRGAGSTGEFAAFKTDLNKDEDRIWYQATKAVWVEDDEGNTYKQDADFVFNGKTIKWVGGRPRLGQRYTCKYLALIDYIVFTNPQERIDKDGTDLGQLVLLRKKHVVFVNESPLVTESDRISLQTRVSC